MGENLKILILKIIAMSMVLTIRTPQQNGVVERKNRTLQKMARTMLNENNLPKYFWAKAVNASCYILNRLLLMPILKKTPYELWKNKKPNISYFKVFGCKCFILNIKDNLGKFDARMLEFFLVTQLQVKPLKFLTKESWL